MSSEQVLAWAQQVNTRVRMEDIAPLPGGYSSQAYKVLSGDDAFVLLTARALGVGTPKYGHAYTIMTVLHRRGYAHAPEPLWLHPEGRALALRFFDGTPSHRFDFTAHGIDRLATATRVMDALMETGVIPFDEYEQVARECGITPMPPQTPADIVRRFGTERFTIAQEGADTDIVSWIEPRLRETVAQAHTAPTNRPTLYHGDPSSGNILLGHNGAIMLIDWDSAGYSYSGPEWLLAYTTNLTDFMRPFQNELAAHLAQRMSISTEECTHLVREYRRYYADVLDVIWAAMMMTKAARGETSEDIEHYRRIAQERIRRYEESFG